jgi:hypothetical protein
MPRISREVIEHKLAIDPLYKPVKQKERRYTPERQETICQDVNKLLKVGFIRLVDYPNWLANPVLVEKPDDSWHMCIDYTSLTKVCPKEEYPMPCIYQIMDSTTSCELLSFLDAYSVYHQISIIIDDKEKTAFITPFRIFNLSAYRVTEEESSHLESAYRAKSSDYSWGFNFSSTALTFSSVVVIWILACCSQITATSRATDLLISLSWVVVREALVDSSSRVNSTLASLEF